MVKKKPNEIAITLSAYHKSYTETGGERLQFLFSRYLHFPENSFEGVKEYLVDELEAQVKRLQEKIRELRSSGKVNDAVVSNAVSEQSKRSVPAVSDSGQRLSMEP